MWGLRHAPELAKPDEGNDVWMLTWNDEDVIDVYGRGFAESCLSDLVGKAEGIARLLAFLESMEDEDTDDGNLARQALAIYRGEQEWR